MVHVPEVHKQIRPEGSSVWCTSFPPIILIMFIYYAHHNFLRTLTWLSHSLLHFTWLFFCTFLHSEACIVYLGKNGYLNSSLTCVMLKFIISMKTSRLLTYSKDSCQKKKNSSCKFSCVPFLFTIRVTRILLLGGICCPMQPVMFWLWWNGFVYTCLGTRRWSFAFCRRLIIRLLWWSGCYWLTLFQWLMVWSVSGLVFNRFFSCYSNGSISVLAFYMFFHCSCFMWFTCTILSSFCITRVQTRTMAWPSHFDSPIFAFIQSSSTQVNAILRLCYKTITN